MHARALAALAAMGHQQQQHVCRVRGLVTPLSLPTRPTSNPNPTPPPNSSGTYFCVDKSVTAVVIQGLAEHKDQLGAPLCPCRHYDDKEAEAQMGYWNCPCVPMRERKVRV